MLLSVLFAGLITTVVSQSTPAVVCVPGQCIQGYSNTTIGAELKGSDNTTLRLLPGEYSSTTNPKLLHDLLTSSSSTLTSSPGFPGSLAPLPLSLKLEPGLAVYSGSRYSGPVAFSSLPTAPLVNSSTTITANSLGLSENVWVAVSGNNQRVVLWDSVPDVVQLLLPSDLNLLDIQSTTCSPACSSSGVCNSSGQCVCPPNFSGPSCESCAAGFFGPQCQPCPEGCESCDEGISGTGRCLSSQLGPEDPKRCNCVNGECNPDGTCACNQGWVDGGDSKCSKCAPGFFLTSSGDCSACQLGCTQCSDTTAVCSSCRPGFNLNPNDRTKCEPAQQTVSTGALCPSDTFSDGTECNSCSNVCDRCVGPGEGDCLTCARGFFMSNGRCVSADGNGICSGSEGLVADTLKRVCDTCPSKCTSCRIPNFSSGSTIDQLQCTGCLPGSVLHNGKCVESCPAGTFVNPQDNLTCIPCSSSCATCAGSASFCLSCPGSLFASDGQCVQSCPAGSFSTTSNTTPTQNSCTKCHPDCESCSGPSFTQCTSCSAARPVLSVQTGSDSGRCLPTCSKSQYFDATTKECKACDGGCASCTGAGADKCLSCQSPGQVVKNGQCVDANCSTNAAVIAGLGLCLSDLVQVPSKTDDTDRPPLPTITGINEPAALGSKFKLQWWQILLMALGCAFIFVMFLWCWRRRARKQRQKRTEMFAKGKGIVKGTGRWNWASWKLFFTRKNRTPATPEGELPIAYNHQDVAKRELGMDIKMNTFDKDKDRTDTKIYLSIPRDNNRNKRQSRDDDLESYIDAYDYSRRSMGPSIHSHTPSTLPDLDGYYSSKRNNRNRDQLRRQATDASRRTRDVERESIYSEMTGVPRHTPEPRLPIKRDLKPIASSPGHSRNGSHSGSSSRASSPPPRTPPNKLRKLQLLQKKSDETLSSIVIAPQKEGVLVDLDAESFIGGYGSSQQRTGQATLPLQYQATSTSAPQIQMQIPTLSAIHPMPTYQSLTDAQVYANAVKPHLHNSTSPDSSPTSTSPSPQALLPPAQTGFMLAWVPTHLTGATTTSAPANLGLGATTMPSNINVGLRSNLTENSVGSYWLQAPQQSNMTFLKPTATGSSALSDGSKNPFRQ